MADTAPDERAPLGARRARARTWDRKDPQAGAPSGPRQRTAVVTVHGVADQAPGDTVRTLASLLTTRPPDGVRYSEAASDCLMLQVPPLEGSVPAMPDPHETPPPMKALRQSLRSDFLRPGWLDRAAQGERQGAVRAQVASYEASVTTSPAAEAPPPTRTHERPDLGLAFTDYLLFKAQRGGTAAETYECRRIWLTRTDASGAPGDNARRIDFHEMYWADLSRLSSSLPPILTELFTILFRMSKLARDTIDHARKGAEVARASPAVRQGWRRLSRLQTALDWGFAHLLANLFLQSVLTGLFIVLMSVLNGGVGAGSGEGGSTANSAKLALAVAGPVLAAWWLAYRWVRSWPARTVLVLEAALAGTVLYLGYATPWVLGLALLTALAVACDAGLRVADRRFVSTRQIGLVFLAMSYGIIAAAMWDAPPVFPPAQDPPGFGPAPPTPPEHDVWVWWTRAALRAFEVSLLGSYLWWGVAAFMLLFWIVRGMRQARLGPQARASITTARLGLCVSLTSFTAVGMVIWATSHQVLENAAGKWGYRPWLFELQQEVAADFWGFQLLLEPLSARVLPAESFLTLRYVYSTASFCAVALLLFALILYILAMLVPSVLAELERDIGSPGDLGRWLTDSYERLEGFVSLVALVSAAVGIVIGLLLLIEATQLFAPFFIAELKLLLIIGGLQSQAMLAPFVTGSVSALGALSLLGRTLSKYAPWLRAPLDAMLDIDNYLREFPRGAIPRARIFARYVALLEHLKEQGATRVVIVAHSQGTVITTDLLRYLAYRARCGDGSRAAVLGQWLDQVEVHLFTAGSPLRQLYAARFPELYRWVLEGPKLGDLGLDRWTNVFTAGDYVGRWIWHPAPEGIQRTASFYDAGAVALDDPPRKDLCVGGGAHTHYFDPDPGSDEVARCIDELIRPSTPPAPPQPRPGDAHREQRQPHQARDHAIGQPE